MVEVPDKNCFWMGTSHIKSCLKKSWMSPCGKTNQSQLSLMTLILFGTQLLLLGVMILSVCDSWCSYHQDLKTICSSIQFLFPKICCLAEFQFEMMFWILIFNFLRIFVLNQWKGLLAWTGSFRIFGDNLWAAVSNVEASNTRLLKTFHQDFWIWLLNLSPWRNSLTRTVFGWEQVISNHASRKVGCLLAAKPTNLSLLWWLSMFLVRRCCCSEWWFCPSVTPDVRTTKIWKQFAARFSFLS